MEYSPYFARALYWIAANEPELRPAPTDLNAGERMRRATHLVIEKALAHIDDPAHYPLPADVTSPERMLVSRLRGVPVSRRKRVVRRLLPILQERRRGVPLGSLACVDLGSRESILAQVKKLVAPVQFSRADERELIDRISLIHGESDLTAFLAVA